MKYFSFSLILLFILIFYWQPSSGRCQGTESNNTSLDTNLYCRRIFEANSSMFSAIKNNPFYLYFTHMSQNVSLEEFLKCSTTLINQGDVEVEDSIISFFVAVKNQLKRSNSLSYYKEAFKTFAFTLGKISSKKAFNLGMEFFSVNVSVFDLISDKQRMTDEPSNNFGFAAYGTVILPMIDPSQREYYRELFNKEYLKCVIQNPAVDNVGKIFHQQFYPRIKKDWEEGKIRLRE